MTEMSHYDQRLNHVEDQLTHLAADVRSLAGTVGQSIAQQQAMAERFDRMADGYDRIMSKEQTIEWTTRDVVTTVVGSIGTVCVMVAALMWGVNENTRDEVALALAPVAGVKAWMDDKDEFQREVHYENGVTREALGYIATEIDKLWAHIHKQEDIDREHDKMLAQAETSRRALGDYLKEHASRVDH